MRSARTQNSSSQTVCARTSCLTLLVSSLALGCSSEIRHPPAFSDFRRAFNAGLETQTGVEAQLKVFEAAMLSDQDLKTIYRGTNVEALIGAGMQGRLDDGSDVALLERATELSSTNSVAWAALAYRSLSLLENKIGDSETLSMHFKKAVETLLVLAPSNSVPLYLQAAFACLDTNVAAAKQLAATACRIDGFDTYETALKKCIVVALESAQYPKYTARIVASGNAPGLVAWTTLNKMILASAPSSDDVQGCLLLGARVGSGRSILNQLVGDSIQMKAMDRLSGVEFAAEKKRIAENKELIKRATRYLRSARTRTVTEAQWVKYYDKCCDSGELDATRWLAGTRGDSI